MVTAKMIHAQETLSGYTTKVTSWQKRNSAIRTNMLTKFARDISNTTREYNDAEKVRSALEQELVVAEQQIIAERAFCDAVWSTIPHQ